MTDFDILWWCGALLVSGVVGVMVYLAWGLWRAGRVSVDSMNRHGDDWLARLSDGRVYRGACTVWHRYPYGARAPTWLESRLCEAWQAAKWREEERK